VVICLERGADLHTAQPISLPLTVSCFSKIQIGFTFLVPAHLGSPGQRAIKRGVFQQGHTGSKTLPQRNHPVLNWRSRLMRVDLYNGCKMVVSGL